MNGVTPAKMPDNCSEPAPAKVNLALHVTGRRADGYHLLDTLVVFTEAGDTVAAATSENDRLVIEGRFGPSLSASSDNLVALARDLLRSITDEPAPAPVELTLDKALPIASGIGGGSSDAAATLRLLVRHWNLTIDPVALAKASLALGADVPMCLAARSLRARGIGEAIEPASGLKPLHIVLVNPGVAVSTPAVFRALQRSDNMSLPDTEPRGDLHELVRWMAHTRNDLQDAAISIAPAIGQSLDALSATGAAVVRMSGSGATCFGLYTTHAEAERAARIVAKAQPAWYVQATRTIERTADARD